eukprot:5272115-Lingulodinium_polyedra.AAC.1
MSPSARFTAARRSGARCAVEPRSSASMVSSCRSVGPRCPLSPHGCSQCSRRSVFLPAVCA